MMKRNTTLRIWSIKLYTHLEKIVCLTVSLCGLLISLNLQAENLDEKIKPNQHNLVILQYHHVSQSTPDSTSVSPQVFAEHMALLANNYHVIDLTDAIKKLKNNEKLPDKSVAITFDDGFINILENAHPILQEYKFPYTIFINPSIIGVERSQLDWQQVKLMQPLATFANHTLDHIHLLDKNVNESNKQWLTRIMQNIEQAEQVIQEKVGYSKKWLAFPYGEFNTALKQQLLASGYIGFGQQSGAVSHFSDFGALPRFPAAGVYANLDSLKTKLDSLAMPFTDFYPADTQYASDQSLSHISFTVASNDVRINALTCYFGGNKLRSKKHNKKMTITVNYQMLPGRTRINCTAPSHKLVDRFYWYSYPLFTSTAQGNFLN